MESPPDPPRRLPEPHALHGHPAPFEPSRQGIPLVKVERVFCPEKLEDGARKREALEKYPPPREPGAPEHGGFAHAPFLAELEKSTQSILSQQRPPLAPAAPFGEAAKPSSPYRAPPPRAQDPMYIYDEFVQQHRRLVSKLDLEERRRREAREKGELGARRALGPPRGCPGVPRGCRQPGTVANPGAHGVTPPGSPNQSGWVNPPLETRPINK